MESIIELYRQGMSGPSIAFNLEVPLHRVYKELRSKGVKTRNTAAKEAMIGDEVVRLYESGLTGPEVAGHLGVPVAWVYRALRKQQVPRRKRRPSLAVVQKTLEAQGIRKRGLTYQAIGDRLGTSRQRVHQMLSDK